MFLNNFLNIPYLLFLLNNSILKITEINMQKVTEIKFFFDEI